MLDGGKDLLKYFDDQNFHKSQCFIKSVEHSQAIGEVTKYFCSIFRPYLTINRQSRHFLAYWILAQSCHQRQSIFSFWALQSMVSPCYIVYKLLLLSIRTLTKTKHIRIKCRHWLRARISISFSCAGSETPHQRALWTFSRSSNGSCSRSTQLRRSTPPISSTWIHQHCNSIGGQGLDTGSINCPRIQPGI